MSIKLYNGFKCNLNIISFQKKLDDFRDRIKPIAKEKYAKLLLDSVVSDFDTATYNNKNTKDIFNTFVRADIEKSSELRETSTRSMYDFGFALSIFPTSKYLLGIIYTEYDAFRTKWFNQPFIQLSSVR